MTRSIPLWTVAGVSALVLSALGPARTLAQQPFEPQVGQPGKDVVWVPTPPALVEKMLDLAQVTAQDYVVDLGSGDGRNVIGAAKRGARSLGVEFNPDMVALSRRNAAAAGVADKATFVQGDMYTADFSQASVMALFLLPSNMLQLRSKFLDLKAGSRIVSNTFLIEGWAPDETVSVGGDCQNWCQAVLWVVPAKVSGEWRLPQGTLSLSQEFQNVSGTLAAGDQSTPATGKLRGDLLTLSSGGQEFSGRVTGDTIAFAAGAGRQAWTASRMRP